MASSVVTSDHQLTPDWISFLKAAKGVSSESLVDAFKYEQAVDKPPALDSFRYAPDAPIKAVYHSRQPLSTVTNPPLAVGDDSDILLLPFESHGSLSLRGVLLGFGVIDSAGETTQSVVNAIIKAVGLDRAVVVDQNPRNRNAVWLMPAKAPVKDVDNMKEPMVTLQNATSLTFKLDGTVLSAFVQDVAKHLDDEFGTSLSPVDDGSLKDIADLFSFTVSNTTTGTLRNDSTFDITVTPKLTFTVRVKGFVVNLIHERNAVSLTVQEERPEEGDLLTKLSNLMAATTDDNLNPTPKSSLTALQDSKAVLEDQDHAIHLKNVAFRKDLGDTTTFWEAQFYCHWKVRNDLILWIGLAYNSRTKTFEGGLLFERDFADEAAILLPYFDESMKAPGDIPKTVDLHNLFAEMKSLPDAIPQFVSQATLRLIMPQTQTSPVRFELEFAIQSEPPKDVEDAGPVPSPFVWSSLVIKATKEGEVKTVHVDTAFQINPRPEDVALYTPATMTVSMDYDGEKNNFDLNGNVNNLQFGALANYADPSFSSAFGAILGKLVLSQLQVRYTIDNETEPDGKTSNKASSFLMLGKIRLGLLELDLVYQYTSKLATETATEKQLQDEPDAIGKVEPLPKPTDADKSTGWAFEANLGAADTAATLREVVASINETAASDLPGFVGNIMIEPSKSGDSLVRLTLSKTSAPAKSDSPASSASTVTTTTAAKDTALLLTLRIVVGPIDFTFVQLCENGQTKTSASITTTTPPVPKRLLRVKVGALPPLPANVPVLEELVQPFQSCQYVYVGAGGALTTKDVEAINVKVGESAKIWYKESNKPAGASEAAGSASGGKAAEEKPVVALVVGHHLQIVHAEKCILDHVFNNAKSKTVDKKKDDSKAGNKSDPASKDPDTSKDSGKSKDSDSSKASDAPKDAPAEDPAPTKGALKAKTKLLTIESVALQYKDGILWIMLDVTVALGPVALSLIGFGIGLPLGDDSLHPTVQNLVALVEHVQFQIHGIGVSFEKPPLLIAGAFEHEMMEQAGQEIDAYRGGIGVSFKPYTFVAVGQYAKVSLPGDANKYKSLFVFAKLDGPLITLEFGKFNPYTGRISRLAYNLQSCYRHGHDSGPLPPAPREASTARNLHISITLLSIDAEDSHRLTGDAEVGHVEKLD